ncbi:MAG: ABC transporter ATP-binding protein/permease [Oscillospiraceae bacterium]|nr:ABC transporter ATP-binding protein/permease [Oscillospiraceae bacterium]
MRQILTGYWGEYKNSLILTPIFVLFETIVTLALPTLMSNIVDTGVANGDRRYIILCGLLMTALALFSAAAGYCSTWHASRASNGFGSNLRVAMFHHIQDFSFSDIDRFSTASLVTRTTSDVRQLQNAMQMMLRTLIQAPFQLIVALVIVCTYSWKLALIYLIAVPLLFIGVVSVMSAVDRLFTIVQQKLDAMTADIQENLIAIRVVKAFVRQEHEKRKFKKANDDLTLANLKAVGLIIVMSPLATIVLNIVTLCLYWFGGRLVAFGEIQSGQLLAVISYLTQIMFSVMMFSMVLMQYIRSRACGKRIAEVLNTIPDIQTKPNASAHTIAQNHGSVEFKNVSFRYAKAGAGEEVLKNISFTAQPGQTIAIVGGTGAGKSSLVNLIPRFYDVSEGQVLVDGVDVRDYRIEDLRDGIGMVLQNNVLFSGTIRENISWGRADATDEEIIQALKNAQAWDFVSQMPEGLDTYIQQGGTNVSGGQKQRLCIARAMLKHPAILILDDSTSAVDSDTEGRIRDSFSRELKDTTVFIIAQRISSVVLADKIIVLDEGCIDSLGTHGELMETSKIYREIYTSQVEEALSDG